MFLWVYVFKGQR